ncbi:hypothetical protein KFK09_010345 [Dendrobium nobile]|uniref:Uncharacterized protein n=1 Tax=Dendrobium nobile TaxID=94219 RepID=A0A8T3BKD1_DENNO|nr:hypothetical protein KFK09_010345 [Dendrobium nobile]
MKKETPCRGLLFLLDSFLLKKKMPYFNDFHNLLSNTLHQKREKSRLSCRGYPKQL